VHLAMATRIRGARPLPHLRGLPRGSSTMCSIRLHPRRDLRSWSILSTAHGDTSHQHTSPQAPVTAHTDDFAAFVDTLHEAGIGVISTGCRRTFPPTPSRWRNRRPPLVRASRDARQRCTGVAELDLQLRRNEVRSFLISGAASGSDRFHADGLRMDGVASMLYLDYFAPTREWVANRFGGNETWKRSSCSKSATPSCSRRSRTS